MTAPVIPRFNRGFRLRHDEVRGSWVLLAPERLFVLDEHALEVLKLVDGERSVTEIVDALAAKYNAPTAEIAGDVEAMLQDLVGKGAIQL